MLRAPMHFKRAPASAQKGAGILPGLVVLAGLLAAAVAFNPGYDAHRAKIEAALSESHPVGAAFGIPKLASLATDYHSVGVASYTKSNGKIVSVGVLGVVVVFE